MSDGYGGWCFCSGSNWCSGNRRRSRRSFTKFNIVIVILVASTTTFKISDDGNASCIYICFSISVLYSLYPAGSKQPPQHHEQQHQRRHRCRGRRGERRQLETTCNLQHSHTFPGKHHEAIGYCKQHRHHRYNNNDTADFKATEAIALAISGCSSGNYLWYREWPDTALLSPLSEDSQCDDSASGSATIDSRFIITNTCTSPLLFLLFLLHVSVSVISIITK